MRIACSLAWALDSHNPFFGRVRSILLACAAVAAAGCATPRDKVHVPVPSVAGQPQPVVVLLRHSAWVPAIQWPLFVLYDDGTAVFPRTQNEWRPQTYQAARISLPDRDRALAALGITPGFFELKPRYDFAPNVSDQETVFLLVWRGDSLTSVAVRAGIGSDGKFVDGVPQAFRDAYQTLTRYESAGAVAWEPKELRVAAWPYEYAPDNPPLPWPHGWPDLRSQGSECHADDVVGEMCTLHLPSSDRPVLERLLAQRRQMQAIGINGRKMVMSYHLLFPGEEVWRKAIGSLES